MLVLGLSISVTNRLAYYNVLQHTFQYSYSPVFLLFIEFDYVKVIVQRNQFDLAMLPAFFGHCFFAMVLLDGVFAAIIYIFFAALGKYYLAFARTGFVPLKDTEVAILKAYIPNLKKTSYLCSR